MEGGYDAVNKPKKSDKWPAVTGMMKDMDHKKHTFIPEKKVMHHPGMGMECPDETAQDMHCCHTHAAPGEGHIPTPALLAHAYVPWQCYTKAFSPQEALKKGTLFPELYGLYPLPV